MNITEGSIHPPKGFKTIGIHCGLKPNNAKDFALIVSDRPATAAGTFTTNRVFAAPVAVNREYLENGQAQAIVVNSKNANACTGDQGLLDARQTAAWAAEKIGCATEDVLINSTGVIGVPLPLDKIKNGIEIGFPQLSENGWDDAANAIMTTDTVPKKATVQLTLGGATITISGIAKGAGMIAPNMATMLSFITTDAKLSKEQTQSALKKAVVQSFNCITVDGDMSTNDTVLFLANGAAENQNLSESELETFQTTLNALCESLAKQIARDGEGATKLITIHVTHASSFDNARTIGLSVANSSLVKTAVFGRDPNWGRILCAVGYAGVDIDPQKVTVSMAGIPIFGNGGGLPFDKDQAIESLGAANIDIDIDLNNGESSATLYTCDLTYDYVRINAEYTT